MWNVPPLAAVESLTTKSSLLPEKYAAVGEVVCRILWSWFWSHSSVASDAPLSYIVTTAKTVCACGVMSPPTSLRNIRSPPPAVASHRIAGWPPMAESTYVGLPS